MVSSLGEGAGAAEATTTGTIVAARQAASIERTAARSMLVAHLTPDPAGETTPLAVEVAGEPVAQPEPALDGREGRAGGGHPGHAPAEHRSVDREHEGRLEADRRL